MLIFFHLTNCCLQLREEFGPVHGGEDEEEEVGEGGGGNAEGEGEEDEELEDSGNFAAPGGFEFEHAPGAYTEKIKREEAQREITSEKESNLPKSWMRFERNNSENEKNKEAIGEGIEDRPQARCPVVASR